MQNRSACLIATLFILIVCGPCHAQSWQQLKDPSEAGWDAAKLDSAREMAESIGSAAVMIVDRGIVVEAWGAIDRPFKCHSVRKSVLSALIGIEVSRGSIDLDATLEALGIDDIAGLSETERSATVRSLMASRSGVYHPAAKEPGDMKASRPARGSAVPDERFWYNNWDFNTLGAIYEQLTGKDVCTAFASELAGPLGMQDFAAEHGSYELEPSHSQYPAYAFRLSARDLARFGQLFTSGGKWGSQEIVPEAWVRESTRQHTTFEDGRGYGLMWWSYPAGTLPAHPHANAFEIWTALGTGGQVVAVIPEIELVIVHRGDTDNNRRVSGGDIWHLIEAVLSARGSGSVPADAALGALRPEALAGVMPEPKRRVAVSLSEDELAAYVGRYAMGPSVFARVHMYKGRLFVVSPDGLESELFAEARDSFFLGNADVQVRFERDASGEVAAALLTMNGRPMPAAPRMTGVDGGG